MIIYMQAYKIYFNGLLMYIELLSQNFQSFYIYEWLCLLLVDYKFYHYQYKK